MNAVKEPPFAHPVSHRGYEPGRNAHDRLDRDAADICQVQRCRGPLHSITSECRSRKGAGDRFEEVGAPRRQRTPVSPATGTETGRHAGYPVRDRRSYGIGTAETFVREHPVASLLGALSAGFVIGALLSRSGRGQAVSAVRRTSVTTMKTPINATTTTTRPRRVDRPRICDMDEIRRNT